MEAIGGVIELPNFFSPEEIGVFLKQMELFADKESFISNNQELSEYWSGCIKSRLPHLLRFYDGWHEVHGIGNQITIGHSTKPIKKHIDPKLSHQDIAKIVIYLNDSVGTCFNIDGEEVCFKGGAGNALLFDIRLEHWGDAQQKGEMKIVGGFRVQGRKIIVKEA